MRLPDGVLSLMPMIDTVEEAREYGRRARLERRRPPPYPDGSPQALAWLESRDG